MALLAPDRLRQRPSADETLVIGLVNNMPDAALKTTERQFRELLAAAAGDIGFRLRFFSFAELPRSTEGRRHVAEHHEPIEQLWDSEFDGLIVTGAAPVAPSLEEEPCWPALTRLVEWAERHTTSTIWSCLAVHIAVRHIDGIERRPLDSKLSGVFECARVVDHPLLSLVPPRWTTPHSRYNELPEVILRSRGYCILSRSSAAGADIFVKRRGSLFVFLQGHLEYDAGALGREYRRDIAQFLAGHSDAYPEMPAGYFPPQVAAALMEFRDSAVTGHESGLFEYFLSLPEVAASWRDAATGFYAAWLIQIAAKRSCGLGWQKLPLPVDPASGFNPTYA
jgi:homoserine O-succinyltransferase/O-acetyltransferase